MSDWGNENARLTHRAHTSGQGRRRRGVRSQASLGDGDWLAYDSLGAPASIRLSCTHQNYLVAVNHPGAIRDLAERWHAWPEGAEPRPPNGFTAFAVSDTTPLHHLVREIWRLARALPVEPLRIFEAQTRSLPRTTEVEKLIVRRVGQNVFRDALLIYWGVRCAVT